MNIPAIMTKWAVVDLWVVQRPFFGSVTKVAFYGHQKRAASQKPWKFGGIIKTYSWAYCPSLGHEETKLQIPHPLRPCRYVWNQCG